MKGPLRGRERSVGLRVTYTRQFVRVIGRPKIHAM